MARSYLEIYQSLVASPAAGLVGDTLLAEESSSSGIHIACDGDGKAAVFIETHDNPTRPFPIYRLRGAEALYSPDFELQQGGSRRPLAGVLIRCTSSLEVDKRYFLGVCESIASALGPGPAVDAVTDWVDRLMHIFAQLSSRPNRSIIGLIAELLLILRCAPPNAAIAAWHVRTTDRFDFVFQDSRVEVKATSNRQRVHTLSYGQVNPPSTIPAYFASTFVEEVNQGITGRELLEEVLACCDSVTQRLRTHEVVAETLGSEVDAFLEFGFDRGLADQEFKFFRAESVPALRGPAPPGVSRITFQSDFSIIESCAPPPNFC